MIRQILTLIIEVKNETDPEYRRTSWQMGRSPYIVNRINAFKPTADRPFVLIACTRHAANGVQRWLRCTKAGEVSFGQ